MKNIDPKTPIWKLTVEEFLEISKNSTRKVNTNVGLKGLAKILGCSISKASEIKSSGILDAAIIQKEILSSSTRKRRWNFCTAIKMYYQELIQKLWDFNKKTIGSTAIAMYLYLLKLGNDAESYTISRFRCYY